MQLRYVTGRDVVSVQGLLDTFIERIQLDEHFTTYCQLSGKGKALVGASQISIGHKNSLATEVAGTKGTLPWKQEDLEQLTILLPDHSSRPDELPRRSSGK